MSGNVWEWTATRHEHVGIVVRAGSWFNDPHEVLCAYRFRDAPGDLRGNIAFRRARGSDQGLVGCQSPLSVGCPLLTASGLEGRCRCRWAEYAESRRRRVATGARRAQESEASFELHLKANLRQPRAATYRPGPSRHRVQPSTESGRRLSTTSWTSSCRPLSREHWPRTPPPGRDQGRYRQARCVALAADQPARELRVTDREARGGHTGDQLRRRALTAWPGDQGVQVTRGSRHRVGCS